MSLFFHYRRLLVKAETLAPRGLLGRRRMSARSSTNLRSSRVYLLPFSRDKGGVPEQTNRDPGSEDEHTTEHVARPTNPPVRPPPVEHEPMHVLSPVTPCAHSTFDANPSTTIAQSVLLNTDPVLVRAITVLMIHLGGTLADLLFSLPPRSEPQSKRPSDATKVRPSVAAVAMASSPEMPSTVLAISSGGQLVGWIQEHNIRAALSPAFLAISILFLGRDLSVLSRRLHVDSQRRGFLAGMR
ncbi:hypothetical protein V8D89_014574 [Ganoderma adspersum]